MTTVTLDDIRAAAERIKDFVDRTPCRYSRKLSQRTGAEVWVKFENAHFTSSFKERGARNKLMQLSPAEKKRGVIAASAGNHAQALAYHGQQLGVPVTIVMPHGTPFVKIEKTRAYGANVVIEGADFTEATNHVMKLRDEHDYVFVSAFDDLQILTGQGTCGLEMLEDAPDLDAVIVPIGGGGLIAGIASAVKALKPGIKVYGVEAAMYPSFVARRKGEKPKCGGQTIAEGIAIKAVGEIPFAVADPLIDEVLVVDEADFERAVAMYANVEKTVAEGAGAGGLAALLRYPAKFKGQKVGLVLAGGNIDARMLSTVLYRDMVRQGRMVTYRIVGDDRPGVLAGMSTVIGKLGGNILDVIHNRLSLEVPAKGAEYDIVVETRDEQHADEIRQALKESGYVLTNA
ncbi:threonine ammonia-lyase [Caulobacter sp. 17J65-9]|uniref:threonine ammonia-lyase n=1 Tax=Caulobacter sp. 17J65-9 TaxID=2709382 RepID=UPI0013C546DC|nr:threonine ammonia-lyase [Caulobacter sp. 17J65-9]NEX94835.1 threonine ammonia-lyase [Caulobacter sp. 17J65-9]